MRKICIGLVMGVILVLSASVFANSAIVGKVIQGTFPLVINGERASQDVIVVEGTSYLPVRVAGELFGYEVDFQNNTVILKNQNEEQDTPEEGEEVGNIAEFYIYESDVIDIWRKMDQEINIWGIHEKEELPYLLWDEEVYVPWEIFNYYRTSQNTQEYPNGRSFTADPINYEYTKGVDWFTLNGTSMIKLSLTGYSAEIRNGEVWIVE